MVQNGALDSAAAQLLTAAGLDVTPEMLKNASVDFEEVLMEALPDMCGDMMDKFIGLLVDKVRDVLQKKLFDVLDEGQADIGMIEKDLRNAIVGWFRAMFVITVDKRSATDWDFKMEVHPEKFWDAMEKTLKQWKVTLVPETILMIIVTQMANGLQNLPQKNVDELLNFVKLGDVLDGKTKIKAIKAVHSAIKNAWKTGTSIAGLATDVSLLSAMTGGLGKFKMYAALLYSGVQERRDLIWANPILENRAEFLNGNFSGSTVGNLEKLRAALISVIVQDIENLDNYEEMRAIHQQNQPWLIKSYDGKIHLGPGSYYSQNLIEEARNRMLQYLKTLRTVPSDIQTIIRK